MLGGIIVAQPLSDLAQWLCLWFELFASMRAQSHGEEAGGIKTEITLLCVCDSNTEKRLRMNFVDYVCHLYLIESTEAAILWPEIILKSAQFPYRRLIIQITHYLQAFRVHVMFNEFWVTKPLIYRGKSWISNQIR